MAFKKIPARVNLPDNPVSLFQDLQKREHPGLYDHQGQVLRDYHANALNIPDVALQLPTGSGKTLVGMLIAEWRRRKYKEKVLYLCPTRQLVNQVARQANEKYGICVESFLGSKNYFSPQAKSAYQDAEKVSVTTYSSLFNTSPFFESPDIIIFDDAHVSEQYISKQWSMSVLRSDSERVFGAVSGVLKKVISSADYNRLSGYGQNSDDMRWVDKIPSFDVSLISEEIKIAIDENIDKGREIYFKWKAIRDHLHACQIYISVKEILIRPVIPPTWSHGPFCNAKQRIYMSATLGLGGDLERLTGRSPIKRLSVPDGWDKQGIGRRYFVFPEKSLSDADVANLRYRLMDIAGRSLVLTASEVDAKKVISSVKETGAFVCFEKGDLENGKEGFVSCEKAVAVLANRYDGVDFPDDDCRLLFVDNLSKATNLQERFFIQKMAASSLYRERIVSRLLQAIGRCTRGPKDYAAVVVTGGDASNYLADQGKWKYFHPELQAELEFGVLNSKDQSVDSFVDNFSVFIRQDEEWDRANQEIIGFREECQKGEFPEMNELQSSVGEEICWQKALWCGDYKEAFIHAGKVLAQLKDPCLKGYRAVWHYFAASAAEIATSKRFDNLENSAREHYALAKNAAPSVSWLVRMASKKIDLDLSAEDGNDICTTCQVEQIESVFISLGGVTGRKYNAREAEIRKFIESGNNFERGQVLLGELLGFRAGKSETDASPDPWWILDGFVIVFEDHANAKPEGAVIDPRKARQALCHPNWIRENLKEVEGFEVLPVLVTPALSASKGAFPHLVGVSYWNLDKFRAWASNVLDVMRDLRSSFGGEGDVSWRSNAVEKLKRERLDMPSLFNFLRSQRAEACLFRASD